VRLRRFLWVGGVKHNDNVEVPITDVTNNWCEERLGVKLYFLRSEAVR
jgi:hypothetical protein